MSSRLKKRYNFSFSPSFRKAIQDIAYHGLPDVYGKDNKPSASAFLESYITRTIIYNDLKKKNANKKKLDAMSNSPEQICQFWLALREAERKALGYRIHDNSKVGIIGIEKPDPNDPKKRIIL